MSGGSGGISIDQHAAAIADRLGGSLVDLLVVGALAGASYVVFGGLAGEIVAAVAAFAYLTLPVARWGRTLGKVVAHTRVVRARDGRPPTLGQAFERTALLVTPTLVTIVTLPFVRPQLNLYVFLTGVISAGIYTSALMRDDLAGWHDVYARTVVVSASSAGERPHEGTRAA